MCEAREAQDQVEGTYQAVDVQTEFESNYVQSCFVHS